ncbi:MAG: AmmeMemoRadiSam system radical SAM enzyme, partial [Pirellula sp.]
MTQPSSKRNSNYPGRWWHIDPLTVQDEQPRIICDLCPRQCRMKEQDRGFCFVRKIEQGQMVLDTYGKSTGFCIDPIEKKPLNHFYPGTSVLSFGTAGCNLGCQFCQNWDISKSREVAKLSNQATPESIAMAAKAYQCRSVAFTYNDPVVWAEYAIDTAKACREQGIATVAVTAGYMMPEPRREFYRWMDAANVDLKAFSEDFYHKITYSHLEPVLDTLRYLKHDTDVWFEITNLVIPNANDSADELQRMCAWIANELGTDVPIHFSAFHPDFRMTDRPNTPPSKLIEAYSIAKSHGLEHVYVGNVHDIERASTYCSTCGELLIERDWYELHRVNIHQGACKFCGAKLAGRFEKTLGTWGRKRLPIDMREFQPSQGVIPLASLKPGNTRAVHPSSQSMPTKATSMSEPNLRKLTLLDLSAIEPQARETMQSIAARIVAAKVLKQRLGPEIFEPLGEFADHYVYGCFTTLKRGRTLRGCCGFLGRPTRLRDAILEAAQRTAKEDPRMPAISSIELRYLSCHLTLLADPLAIEAVPANRHEHIEVGKHGLRITTSLTSPYGQRGGLLLPSVPVEQGWDVDAYLAGVCRKAGLPADAWRDPSVLLETFEGLEIGGSLSAIELPDPMPLEGPPGDIDSLQKLKAAAVQNMINLSHGATPNYYVLDAMDGTVHTIVLSAVDADSKAPLAHWIQTSFRPGVPLQSSVFELSRAAEQTLRRTRFDQSVDIDLALSALYDPAHHGTLHPSDWEEGKLKASLSDCDLAGVHSNQRAIVALCGERVAVALDPSKSPQELLESAASMIRVRNQPITVMSLGCVSTASSLLASNTPGIDSSDRARKPALAGSFYPADQAQLAQMLEGFDKQSTVAPVPGVRAIMTPHAGLLYSGKLAMDAWKSCEVPETVIIVGPKHTRLGADWAVSPSESWTVPSSRDSDPANFTIDMDLSKRIAQGVQGMELDAAAHFREHGAEVQLPILDWITGPQGERPKLVCIAMGSANWEEIQQAAKHRRANLL